MERREKQEAKKKKEGRADFTQRGGGGGNAWNDEVSENYGGRNNRMFWGPCGL